MTGWKQAVDLVLSWQPLEMETAAGDTRQDAPAAATETAAKQARLCDSIRTRRAGQLLGGQSNG